MTQSADALAKVLEALAGASKEDLAMLAEAVTNFDAPKEAKAPKKARIEVRLNGPDEAKYGIVTVFKIKGDFREPVLGIRDMDDLRTLIEELEVAELELS